MGGGVAESVGRGHSALACLAHASAARGAPVERPPTSRGSAGPPSAPPCATPGGRTAAPGGPPEGGGAFCGPSSPFLSVGADLRCWVALAGGCSHVGPMAVRLAFTVAVPHHLSDLFIGAG